MKNFELEDMDRLKYNQKQWITASGKKKESLGAKRQCERGGIGEGIFGC